MKQNHFVSIKMNRANRKQNPIRYINSSQAHKAKLMSKHIPGQLGHDNFELTKAVAASTFLKTIEPVVFCFFSLA
jgi:hypothetical protein